MLEKTIKIKTLIIIAAVLAIAAVMIFAVPGWFVKKPVITEYTQNSTIINGKATGITLKGNNLQNVVAVYVEDIWEPYCTIERLDSDSVCITLPEGYYEEEQELSLKVQTKVNADLFAYSNTVNVSAIYVLQYLSYNKQIFIDYINGLDNENYIVLMSVKDDSSYAMYDDMVEAMQGLGLKENLKEAGPNKSYIAVIDGKKVVNEQIGAEELEYVYNGNADMPDITVVSANANAGDLSQIIINDTDYSMNERGLNIVVYDKVLNAVTDSVAFDTFETIGKTPEELYGNQ